jgi:hypothetical protein
VEDLWDEADLSQVISTHVCYVTGKDRPKLGRLAIVKHFLMFQKRPSFGRALQVREHSLESIA